MQSFTDKVKNEIKKHIDRYDKLYTDRYDKINVRKVLRVYFVKFGEVNDPKKENHLAFLLKKNDEANMILSHLIYINLEPKVIKRKSKIYMVYLKDEKSIIYLLNYLGANNSSKIYDNIKNDKAVALYVNRTNNFDTANIKKTVEASIKQIKTINKVLKKYKLDSLEKPLQDVIKLRMKNKEASLKEMSEILKVSKSCLVHRFDKLERMV